MTTASSSPTAASSSPTIDLPQSGDYSVQVRYEGDGSRYAAQYGAWSNSLDFGFAFGCNYETRGDYPHKSTSRGSGNEVSAHGWWWTDTISKCPSKAKVEVSLEVYICAYDRENQRRYCYWREINRNDNTIYPGGGSNRRTVVRKDCVHNREEITFRTFIDVDLVGVWDGRGKLKRRDNVYCMPVLP